MDRVGETTIAIMEELCLLTLREVKIMLYGIKTTKMSELTNLIN